MSEVMSCDTFVALGNSTKSKNNIFAKNSDRPMSESQPFIAFPARINEPNTKLKCTYIEIDDVEKTYALNGSKPFWMWGFEHGLNEHGVVIGNEAAWAKDEPELIPGLLGMDLLRLGLERGKTAYEAMHIIIDLLQKHGQGGNASTLRDMRYHNLFILVDKTQGWVLETVNRRWVAKKIKDVVGVSNCYTIETQWDEACDDLKEYAYAKGWAREDEEFNFALAYGAPDDKQRNAFARKCRIDKLLNCNKGEITTQTMKNIMRDHFEGELIESRFNVSHAMNTTVCMHCRDTNSSKTAAAMIVEFKGDDMSCQSCFSTPCTSIYKPFYLTGQLPANSQIAQGTYSEDSAWWLYERLALAVESNYNKHIVVLKEHREKLENEFDIESKQVELEAKKYKDNGETEKALDLIINFTNICWKKADELAKQLCDTFEQENKQNGVDLNRIDVINHEKQLVGIE